MNVSLRRITICVEVGIISAIIVTLSAAPFITRHAVRVIRCGLHPKI